MDGYKYPSVTPAVLLLAERRELDWRRIPSSLIPGCQLEGLSWIGKSTDFANKEKLS